VNYDNQKQVLLVTIMRCNELPVRDVQLNTSDPYVKLQLLPEKRHRVKTRVLRKTTNPVFEETFTFFGITINQIKTISLHFVVLSFDRFSRDDIIGEVLCNLSDFELQVKQELSMTMNIRPRQFKLLNQYRGELLLSVCHQPAANRLTVVVLKARNLPKMDVTGLAGDPYVKIYLLYNGQRIAKKKTHVKKRTLNPVYNESFAFECPANEDIRNLSLEFIVLDWDRVTKNEVIGRVDLGCESGMDLATKHWEQVTNNPRKQIAEWHKLVD
jgi:Ca2+-dependent lipid-binding protein